jgi:DNA-binding response OmpR family regulator
MPNLSELDLRRILVADDDAQSVKSIGEMLRPHFFVDTATTGSRALELWDQDPYYAVLLDADFGPGISGIETAEMIREVSSEVKIIVFSERYSESVKRKVLNLRAQFMSKPLALTELLNELA